MNIQQLAEQIKLHKYNKGHFFSMQGRKVVDYIFSRMLKYNGSFYEKNDTISETTGVSIRTVQRTVKRMQELEMISVQSRRKVCPVTGKTVQSSNLLSVLEYKEFKVTNEIVVGEVKQVEVIVETVEPAQQVQVDAPKPAPQTFNKGSYNKGGNYNNRRKPIRTEMKPDWLGTEYIKEEETDAIQLEREKLMKELEMFNKKKVVC